LKPLLILHLDII